MPPTFSHLIGKVKCIRRVTKVPMKKNNLEQLSQLAFNAQQHSHSPYSNFKVGAAIETSTGETFAGCNVESAAFPLGQCAEATAIGNMVSNGHKRIGHIVIASPNEELCFPCGGCRQKIAEFASDDTPVTMVTKSGDSHETTIGELLPNAFRAHDLDK
ncbi:MAG: cytidine deaminase [Alteromonas sp.]|nr:cytidine deaminase [Alteromonas sp.]MAI37354.1 cytidine deaminase [Alteromonas sp.]OUX88682.1 MAG: cytidine deaminase [Alteromonas sp. TMED35]